jgi:DNA-binding transcriptional ArsR family regulator
MTREVPESVQQFIAKFIHSVSELEVLLLLRDRVAEPLTVEDIGRALLMHRPAIEPRLESLRASNLLTVQESGGIRYYQYAPQTSELKLATEEVAQWYSTHPVAITTLIFSKPIDKMRVFADSFRLRKEEEE